VESIPPEKRTRLFSISKDPVVMIKEGAFFCKELYLECFF